MMRYGACSRAVWRAPWRPRRFRLACRGRGGGSAEVRVPGALALGGVLVALGEPEERGRARVDLVATSELWTGIGPTTLQDELLGLVEEDLGVRRMVGAGRCGERHRCHDDERCELQSLAHRSHPQGSPSALARGFAVDSGEDRVVPGWPVGFAGTAGAPGLYVASVDGAG